MITYCNKLNILCLLQIINSAATLAIVFESSENRAFKKSLGYVEDAYLNFTELIAKYGYLSEQHTITTEDGYQLTVFRILTKCTQVHSFPIILGHGIVDSSDAWILTGPKTGLGYILSNNCYDVWAINFRGNVYSRKHLSLHPDTDSKYWDFSFDENGYYDLPAIIDYVLHETGGPKVNYIGHSQGTTNFLVMGSLKPGYNEKINLSILLAPIAWMKNIRVPLARFLSQNAKEFSHVLERQGINELFAKSSIIHKISELICQFLPSEVCGLALAVSTGHKLGSIKSKIISILIGHAVVGTSLKTVAHYAQLITSGEFERYDEGKAGNIRRYGTVGVPKYDVSLTTCPIVLISAENDWLSTLRDIKTLASRLPNIVENYTVQEPTWSHNNHILGVNSTELIFKKILYYLQTFNKR